MFENTKKKSDIWILPLILSLFVLVDGIAFLTFGAGADRDAILRVTGSSWSQIESSLPKLANYINNMTLILGVALVGFSIVLIASSISGYRRGERWAWIVMWYLPVYFLVTGVLTYREGVNLSFDALSADILFIFFVFSMIAQLLSISWFFPRGRGESKQTTL